MSLRAVKIVAVSLLLLFAATGIVGCSGDSLDDSPKQTTGGIIGAGAGGLLGYAIFGGPIGIIAGVVIGGLAGGAIGARLDEDDKEMARNAAHSAFEANRTGQPNGWENPDTGASGTITPTKTYQTAEGQYCREYTQEIIVGGEKQEATGTACRLDDGSWQIES
jgi:surface antigen